MDIKSILGLFRTLDINNDNVLSREELKNTDFINSVWQNITDEACVSSQEFIRGLSVERCSTDIQKEIQNIYDLPNAPTEGVKMLVASIFQD